MRVWGLWFPESRYSTRWEARTTCHVQMWKLFSHNFHDKPCKNPKFDGRTSRFPVTFPLNQLILSENNRSSASLWGCFSNPPWWSPKQLVRMDINLSQSRRKGPLGFNYFNPYPCHPVFLYFFKFPYLFFKFPSTNSRHSQNWTSMSEMELCRLWPTLAVKAHANQPPQRNVSSQLQSRPTLAQRSDRPCCLSLEANRGEKSYGGWGGPMGFCSNQKIIKLPWFTIWLFNIAMENHHF